MYMTMTLSFIAMETQLRRAYLLKQDSDTGDVALVCGRKQRGDAMFVRSLSEEGRE